ncbi:hypothetical protein BHE74_00016105 [Ensete ventricosum]|nr:hypothetical protein BHE74_00016105 [Ensete ventricosum]
MESQREAARQGRKGTVAVDDCVAAGGGVGNHNNVASRGRRGQQRGPASGGCGDVPSCSRCCGKGQRLQQDGRGGRVLLAADGSRGVGSLKLEPSGKLGSNLISPRQSDLSAEECRGSQTPTETTGREREIGRAAPLYFLDLTTRKEAMIHGDLQQGEELLSRSSARNHQSRAAARLVGEAVAAEEEGRLGLRMARRVAATRGDRCCKRAAPMAGEGTAEEEVAAAARAAVGEVGCDRKGRKVRMRLWLRRKGDGGRQLGREVVVERMGSGCCFQLFFLFVFFFVAAARWQGRMGDDNGKTATTTMTVTMMAAMTRGAVAESQ